MTYEEIVLFWREKQIRTAADIALEMNGNVRVAHVKFLLTKIHSYANV